MARHIARRPAPGCSRCGRLVCWPESRAQGASAGGRSIVQMNGVIVDVTQMFKHGFDGYMKHAYPAV